MQIKPAKSLKGEVRLPGDKSISHRAAMFASFAQGTTRISNFATSADCSSTIGCLRELGVPIDQSDADVTVVGTGIRGFKPPTQGLDCGNSGTTMRLMAGILAGQRFDSVLVGDESLSKRPMRRIIEPLRQMGASIESVDGHAPLSIAGNGNLTGIDFRLPVASAQLKSCVLLAGLHADSITTVIESIPSRDHTERMLRWFGVEVKEERNGEGNSISIAGGQAVTARDVDVPSDISSAAFFAVAAACLDGSDLIMPDVGLNSTRAAILSVLNEFGADIKVVNRCDSSNEPIADIHVRGSRALMPTAAKETLKGDLIANLIDEIPVLAVFGTQVEGGLEVRDASELRVKESDRISTVVENLRLMNAEVEEYDDGFRVERSQLKGAEINSFGDHRIVMAFAVAALLAEGETRIDGAECAAVSFPGFFERLESVTVR